MGTLLLRVGNVPNIPIKAVGGPAVIELMQHFGFIQRKVSLPPQLKDILFEPIFFPFQLTSRAEEVGVVGHVEHCEEADAPWIAVLALGLVDEHGYALVNSFRNLGVAAGTKD